MKNLKTNGLSVGDLSHLTSNTSKLNSSRKKSNFVMEREQSEHDDVQINLKNLKSD